MKHNVDLTRYEHEVARIEAFPPETGKVLLYGSSFFSRWRYEKARKQLSDATGGVLQVANHGFGGAVTDDLLYHYHRLVRPYRPRAVVIRAGGNDVDMGMEARDAAFLLVRLVCWLKADFPGMPICVLKIFDTIYGSSEYKRRAREYNLLLDEIFADVDDVTVLDISPFFYEDPRDIGNHSKLRNAFVEDGLHLTDESYLEMAKYLGNLLVDILHL